MRVYFLLLITLPLFARPFFEADDFKRHREKLLTMMEDNSVAVMRAGETVVRNNDIDYPYRPASDYFYLTGYDRPESRMLLKKGTRPSFILFTRLPDAHSGVWNTAPYSMDEMYERFAPDTVLPLDQFEAVFKKNCRGVSSIYFPFEDKELAADIQKWLQSPWGRYPRTWHDLKPLTAEARLIKSSAEIAALEKAVDITVAAHRAAMRNVKPGLFEYQVNALISFVYRNMGSVRDGFPSIVGSGPNSTILHYEKYDRQMTENDMLVMDIGAEYAMYSADITRTIPVNGRFSPEQKDIYTLVLKAQQAGIEAVEPGARFGDPGKAAAKVLKEGLKKLGLITDPDKDWQFRVWMMHGVSHWLGLDTHDAGSYLATDGHGGRLLEPGMVLTVEPGIYVSADIFDKIDAIYGKWIPEEERVAFKKSVYPAFEKYKNIGVRIEDDILVTEDGRRNLSDAAPRGIEAIESLMALPASFFNP